MYRLAKTVARGYDYNHRTERARWQARLNRGLVVQCACTGQCLKHLGPCPVVIMAGSSWDLMHTLDRTAYLGPGCVPCNRADGGRNGARIRHRPRTIRRRPVTADRW